MTEHHTERQVAILSLGMTMQEASILEWHREDGEHVGRGEVLFTIESEKATLDGDE